MFRLGTAATYSLTRQAESQNQSIAKHGRACSLLYTAQSINGYVITTKEHYEKLRKHRLCQARGRKAIFHRWTELATVVEPSPLVGGHPGGQTNITLAIVEYKNGKVEQVYPGEIKFMDTQEYWPDQEK